MSYILLSGQASPLDPQCLICLRERLTYSVVDLDAPDGVEIIMGVGFGEQEYEVQAEEIFHWGMGAVIYSSQSWDPKFFSVM